MIEFQQLFDYFQNLEFEVDLQLLENPRSLSDMAVMVDGIKVFADSRSEVRPNHLPILIGKSEMHNPFLVAARYITPNAKETLKGKNINYIDSFGNVFLDLPKLKVFIEKGDAKPVYNSYSDVFTTAGGQVLFQLLQDPERINLPYRDLAEISQVSLGSVSRVINGLIKEGFALPFGNNKKYHLNKREELLEKWVSLFNEKLLPASKIGNFRFKGSAAFEIRDPDQEFETRWGGESGAASLTDYLRPQYFTLFTNRSKRQLPLLGLIPDQEGIIRAHSLFWKPGSCTTGYEDHDYIAHPLLIYAELQYSRIDRNLETAAILFEEYIKPKL